MTRWMARLGLPLLEKELLEQAARRRTYVIRVSYALFLFWISFFFFYGKLVVDATSPLAVLGRGRDLFLVLVHLQFAGIFLFMPALAGGALTEEKERASLPLLFLTRLGPWTILFEKLLGRLVPMLGFLLLSLPLLAVAYSLGGISTQLLWSGLWMLVLSAIEIGILALACSAYFRTTGKALVAAYAITITLSLGPFFAWLLLYLAASAAGIDFGGTLLKLHPNPSPTSVLLSTFPFFGPAYFFGVIVFPGGLGFWALVAQSASILSVSGFFLGVARFYVVRRATLPPRSAPRNSSSFFDRGRARDFRAEPTTQAAAVRGTSMLPGDDPIAWREAANRSRSRPHSLMWILLRIELPLALCCAVLIAANWLGEGYSDIPRKIATAMLTLMWAVAVLVVSVRSASLFSRERLHQTLEVLCTTPMSGRDMILQKFRGIVRMMLLISVPFFTIAACAAWLRDSLKTGDIWYRDADFSPLRYLACTALSLAVYLPLVAWLSLLIGLRVRTPARAMLWSIAAMIGWCVAPFILVVIPLGLFTNGSGALYEWSMLLSPATVIVWNEFGTATMHRAFGDPLFSYPLIFNFVCYGSAVMAIRRTCLNYADYWLGRIHEKREMANQWKGALIQELHKPVSVQ